jgi:starvation-inducible DNA-binding protein
MTTQTLVRAFGEVGANPVGLETYRSPPPSVKGLNLAYASFQALYLQYQKHHFVVEGSEFYSASMSFLQESYEATQGQCPRCR